MGPNLSSIPNGSSSSSLSIFISEGKPDIPNSLLRDESIRSFGSVSVKSSSDSIPGGKEGSAF